MKKRIWIAVAGTVFFAGHANAGYSGNIGSMENVTGYCSTASGQLGKVVDAKQYGYVCSEQGVGAMHGYQQCVTSSGEAGQLVDGKEYGHICVSYRSDITQSRYACTNEMGKPGYLVDAKEYGYICKG
ncbi:hypothetical protein [Vibrio agarivorans]|uniref:hypothetical protein n=1 Tax=Vibrio agarivorans TaxID=153622 RepID=UPI0025B5614E|nr:hypothetical protein [Vibrio agarivorans]MDN3660194.1 hypothetical protein [Vibrio agarivorans]